MEKILIINPFGIGDVLFTTPVIRAIKDAYPDSFIGYWCNQRVQPLLLANPRIDKIFALNRGDLKKIFQESFLKGIQAALKLMLEIRKERFDICFDFSLDHRYSLLAKIIGIKQRIGFDYKGRGRFLTDKIALESYSDRHAVLYYLELLKFLKIESKDKTLELVVPEANEIKARDTFAGRGIEEKDLVVGIAPGAGGSWGKDAGYKHWPGLKFAQVADKLIDQLKVKVVILGDISERQIADLVVNAMRNRPVDLVGKVSLEMLPAIIKNCDLFISNDGGPMHMAVALGVKTVSIFGPVSDLVYGPFPSADKHIVLKWPMDCQPCYKNFRLPVCDKDRECLKQVSVEAVFDAAKKLLK
jgi:lipopolysaccharide heptosyltransferase II